MKIIDKELCFIIDNKKIYLEHSLVNFNEDPIFFVCSDSSSYYLCLYVNIQKMKYYITKVDATILYKLLNQSITMRQSILSGYDFWIIDAYEDEIGCDIVQNVSLKALSTNLLPNDSYFDKSFSLELVEFSKELFSQMVKDSEVRDEIYDPNYKL